MIAFEIIIIQGLLFHNAVITFFAFILLFLFYKNSFLSIILLTPLIEAVLIATEGLTITKMLSAFFIFFFIFSIIQNNIIVDKRCVLLFAYLLITIVGLFNAIVFGDFLAFINWDYESILNYNLLSTIPKIIFAMGMFLFIRNDRYQFLKSNLILATKLIPMSLIVVSIYFITSGHETLNWRNLGLRMTFGSADPNNFSAMLVALGAFSFFLVFKSISKLWTFVGIVSSILVIYSVLLTASRGGILTLVFTTIFTLILLSRRNFKRSILVLFFLIFAVLALFYSNLIDFNFIYERFFGKYVTDISSLTSRRTDWWKAAIEAFKQKPMFGYGGSYAVSYWINFNMYGKAMVMHNLFTEILIQYGVVGLTIFLLLIIRILADLKNLLKLNRKHTIDNTYLIIPFISLATMLFAGLALSWQWHELLWYLISLCFVIGSFVDKYVHENSISSLNQKQI